VVFDAAKDLRWVLKFTQRFGGRHPWLGSAAAFGVGSASCPLRPSSAE